MADVESNIHVNIDTSDALASLKLLQRQISAFHTQMAKSGTAASAVAANQAQNLMNSINATGQFQASMRNVTTSTENFTNALERNKLTSREYFRYTGAATKTFGKLFRSEFETLNKVARERVKDLQTQYIKMGRGANGALQAIAVRPLTLDMKNLGTQTAIAAQRQQLLNQLLKQGSTNLLNFGKNTQWAGRQLMVGFTVPLAMLGTTAAKTFMKLEEQAIRFKRVYGEMFTTQEETDQMVKQIQLLAKEYTKYGVAVEDTMRMAADAAAMGKMGAELTAQVSEATRLAVLGGVEQTQALETTISVTNAFGVAAEDLAGKIDFLNAVENQTVVSIEDLTIAIPKAGPVVQQLGGDVEDLAFFLTAMKEGGINASEGANALKSGLASLINPSAKASAFLGDLGVNIKAIVEGNKGDIKATVVSFAQALDTLDPLNRARAIEQLFGKFQFSRLSTLFQNVTAQGTQASRVLELTKATTEELAILSERELDKIQNTTTYKFKKSMEDLKLSLAPVGEQFLKALTPIVEFVGKILEKFNNLGDGSKKFLTIFTVAVAGVGPILLMTFGLIANAVANIIKMFANMKSMYNRTGASSKVLGEQTNYLTKEQLEASAVAASLDQVHQKLRQTFTSETAAVNTLANAYRSAIAAQIGFTGPVRGGGMKGPPQSKKYSTGTTRVPGTGNQDTVASMLTPGEAVIPSGVAQDPRFKPIIAAMVNGKVEGFNDGTTGAGLKNKKVKAEKPVHKVTFEGREYNAKSAQAAKTIRDLIDGFVKNADGTLTYLDPEDPLKSKTFTKERITEVLSRREAEGNLSQNKVDRSLLIGHGDRGTATGSSKPPWIDTLVQKAKEDNKTTIFAENEAIERELKKRGIVIEETKKGNLFGIQASHLIEDLDADGNKIWRAANIAPEPGYINNYMNTIKGDLGRDLLAMTDDQLRQVGNPPGINREELRRLVDGEHPRTAIAAETMKKIAQHDIAINTNKSGIYQAHVVEAGLDFREKSGAYGSPIKSLAEMFPTDKRVIADTFSQRSKAAMQSISDDVKSFTEDRKNKKLLTKYGRQISPTSGWSFPVAGVGGLYEDLKKNKVFVKPVLDERAARAEIRATRIAREVHGFDAPEQTIKTMIDPSDEKGKRKIIVLESPYNEAFDESKMSKTFTREQYIRQLLAAGLRGDKDLKAGNLGGNVVTDVGAAGVFSKASGPRDFAEKMPSVFEMSKIIVGTGTASEKSPFWFSSATAEVAKGMTAQEFANLMDTEIDRALPPLRETVKSFNLIDPPPTDQSTHATNIRKEKAAYDAMLARLEEAKGQPWEEIHKLHTSIAVKPDEVIQDDKTGKIEKPKTQPLPSNVKSSAGPEDTRIMSEPKKGTSVRQKPRRYGKVPKVTIPGEANAPDARIDLTGQDLSMPGSVKRLGDPAKALVKGAKSSVAQAKTVGEMIGTTISQSAIAASKTALYGTGPVDAEAKSVRRRMQKIQREEGKTQAKAAASRTALYGTGPIDADAKSLRRQEQRRAKLANSVGYPGRIITDSAVQNAQNAQVGPMLGPDRPSKYDKTVGRARGAVRGYVAPRVEKVKQFSASSRGEKISTLKGYAAGKMAPKLDADGNKISRSGKVAGAAGAAGGVAMVASMAPGKVGEMAQKLMMPLMGLSMILPMVQSKFGALALGIGAVVAAYTYMRVQFDKAQDSAFDLTTAMGVGKDAMVELSKSAGKVSAGEQMDRRRENKFNLLPIQNGKSTFGQSFVKQNIGKDMLANIGKSGGAMANIDTTASQLQNAVISGSMSIDQAKSVAANLAKELGDTTFGVSVIGKLDSMLGPDGKDLENNPYEVRVKMIEETRTRMNYASAQSNEAGGYNKGRKENLLGVSDSVQTGGGILAGAGAGAGIGAGIGAVLGGGIFSVPAAAIGAIAGTIVGGIAGGIMANVNRKKRIGTATGASVAQDKMALEQGQELLDSFDLQYQRKIELLKVQGKINEANELENKYAEDRVKLLAQNKTTKDMVLSNFKGSAGDIQDAYMTGTDKAVTKKYKDTVFEDMVPLAQSGIDDSELTKEQKLSFKLEMESGAIDPNQMINMFRVFTSKEEQELVLGIVGKFGGKFAAETTGIVNGFGDNAALRKDYLLQIKYKPAKDVQGFQDFFGKLQTYGNVIDYKISSAYFLKNPTAQADLQGVLSTLEKSKGELGIDFVAKTIGGDALAALNADSAYFNSLPKEQRLVYATALATQLTLEGDPEQQKAFKLWQAKQPGAAPKDYLTFSSTQATAITKASTDNTLPTGPEVDPGGGGSQIKSSPLDDLVKRLRDVRLNQLKVTEGWGASQKALNKLFAGDKTIKVFSGIENDMRKLGAGEDLIELIVGMDPKEYEKRKNSLFEFDKKGNITKLKDNAKSIGDAIASISLGTFVSEQEKMAKQIVNQTTALKRLKAAGVEGSVALEAVADATFAASIANKKLTDAQIKKIVETWNKATAAKKRYAAVEALTSEDKEMKDRVDLLTKLGTDAAKLTMDELEAVMSSPALQNAFITLGVDDVRFKETLANAVKKADVELNINKVTISGMEKIFEDGYNNAMEEIDVKERALEIKFDVDTQGYNKTIQDAQDKIAAAQYKIDDKEALLKEISDREQEINDKYDERVAALDEIEKANASISQQQKGQLTLADALTSGDIAAAARAAQEMRAQQAADAASKQRDLLDKSREEELSRVKTKSGKTREELEKEIKELQDEIFNLEEEKIEPANDAIRKLEVELRKAKEPLEVARDTWEAIRNKIDLAKVATQEYQTAITNALNAVNSLNSAYLSRAATAPAPSPAAAAAAIDAVVPSTATPEVPEITAAQEADEAAAAAADALAESLEAVSDAVKAADLAADISLALAEEADKAIKDLQAQKTATAEKVLQIKAAIIKAEAEPKPKKDVVVKDPVVKKPENPKQADSPAIGETRYNGSSLVTWDGTKWTAASTYKKAPPILPPIWPPQTDTKTAPTKLELPKITPTKPTLQPTDPTKKRTPNVFDSDGDGVANIYDKAPNDPLKMFMGGIVPRYFSLGGFAKGTDTVPAMLTPGEFIMSKYAVDSYGVDNLKKINNGESAGGAVYNNTYTLTVNAKTNASPNEIANAVMSTIKRVDDRRIKGVSING